MPAILAPEQLARFASVGRDVHVYTSALVLKPEVITLGDGARIDDFARIEGGLGTVIGRYVHIASFASVLGGGQTQIGDYSGIAQGARIITGMGHPFEDRFPAPPPEDDPYHCIRGRVFLGPYSFIAANAVVTMNVTVGEGAVVAAGAVVTHDVDPWTVVAGIPARPMKLRRRWLSTP